MFVTGCANLSEKQPLPRVLTRDNPDIAVPDVAIVPDQPQIQPEIPPSRPQPQVSVAPPIKVPELVCPGEDQKIGQVLAVLLTQKQLRTARPQVARGQMGFIGLVGKSDSGVAASLEYLQRAAPFPLLIASDEESKVVQRLAGAIGPLPSVKQLLKMPSTEVQVLFKEYGLRMRKLGVLINFAPVLDVGFGPGIGQRAFSADATTVTEYAGAVARGLLEAGVMPVFKHFPGHGRASADSHESLPVTPDFLDLQTDLLPYRQLLSEFRTDLTSNGLSEVKTRYGLSGFDHQALGSYQVGVMVAHLQVPGLTQEYPSSLSIPVIDGLLRNELKFDGIVFTDALNMGAITDDYTSAEAAVLALRAGADVIVLSGLEDLEPAIHAIKRALRTGELSIHQLNNSVRKIYQLKNRSMTPCFS